MLSDLTSLAKYPEVKRTAEDQERWRSTNNVVNLLLIAEY